MNSRFKDILSKGSILLGGSALAQLLTFLSYPILSHWVTADKWAVFGVFSAVVALFAVMANGGYEQAIMLPKENSKAIALWKLCQRYTAAVGLLGVAFIVVKILFFPDVLTELQFDGIIPALFVSIYFEGSIISTVIVLNRAEQYKSLAKGRAIQAFTSLVLQIGMSFIWRDLSSVLIWGWIAGQAAHYSWLFWQANKYNLHWSTQDISIRQVASEYKRFFKYSVASSYINTLSRQLPFLILPFWLSENLLGQFTFAHKILSAPLGLIGATITQVFNAQSSKSKRGEADPIHTLTRQWSMYMVILGLPVVAAILLFGPSIFDGVFGSEYRKAGEMAQWLCPWLFLLYWISPLSSLISTENKLREHFYYNVVLLVFRLIAIVGIALAISGEAAVKAYSMVGLLFSLLMLTWLWWLSKHQEPTNQPTKASQEVSLIFAGDTCISGRFQEAMRQGKEIFSDDILAKFKHAQGVCVNFEGPELDVFRNRKKGESVTNAPGSLKYLSDRGVNVFNLANNHILDEGTEVAERNVNMIMMQGDAALGLNEKGRWSLTPHYICFNGVTIALMALEESVSWSQGELKESIKCTRQQSDYIVIQYHGGEEYSRIPFPFKKKRLDFLMGLDVDVIIAHHPHVAQPLIHQNNKWMAFSLGNFVFDIEEHQGRAHVNEGLMIEMKIDAAGIHCTGVPVRIDPIAAMVSLSKLSVWQETQRSFYRRSYGYQWAAECNRIRKEERLLSIRSNGTSAHIETSAESSSTKWSSLFNPPRRSLFFGDICFRLFYRFL